MSRTHKLLNLVGVVFPFLAFVAAIGSLALGLDTLVGEEGTQLSGGQRQRLTLARALLSEAPVLILDEPTAHLDPETAQALMDDVFEAAGERTVLLITHRPEGLEQVDEVARQIDATPGQVALAWLLAQGDDIAPIPGTKQVHYLEENVAADALALTADHLAALDDVAAPVGDRYEDMSGVDR